MEHNQQSYNFSTTVSDRTSEDEFVIEFSPISAGEEKHKDPITTKNFDELLDFLECINE